MKITGNFILWFGWVVLVSSCKSTGQPEKNQDMVVKVAQVKLGESVGMKEFSFIAKPFRSSELSFRVGGPIDRFEVYAGNYYKRGDIIAEVDPRDFRIRKERAEAIYRQAKAEYARVKVLYEKSNLSASAFEKAEMDYVTAKMAFETAVNELEDTKLIAPFDGYVGEVYIEKYQDVKATQPVISFVDIDRLKIEAYVSQEVAFSQGELKKIDLTFDVRPGHIYSADLLEISKNTTPNNLSYLLTATLPNQEKQLLAGMSGKVFLHLNSETTVIIPQQAVCHRPSVGDYVWVVNPDTRKVERKKIVVNRLLPEGVVAVRDGLVAEELVAVSGLRFLSEDMSVRIAPESHKTQFSGVVNDL